MKMFGSPVVSNEPSVTFPLLGTICHLFSSSPRKESWVKPVSRSRYTPSRRNPSEMPRFKLFASFMDTAETAIAIIATYNASAMGILAEPVFMSFTSLVCIEVFLLERLRGRLDLFHERAGLDEVERAGEVCQVVEQVA